jgi:hypothetical protein
VETTQDRVIAPAAPRRAGRLAAVLASPATLVITYAIVVGITLMRHAIWLDEAQAWCVARDSHSLRELLWNLRYDGHPALWYLCLFVITRMTSNPVAMQILHGMVATVTVAVIAWRAPLTIVERWLLAFGYLFAFEYAVISRGYGIGVLLVLAVCVWCANPERRVWPIALALCALANTSVYGTVLALCLLAALGIDLIVRTGRLPGKAIAAAVFVLAGCAFAIRTMMPAADYAFAREWHTRMTTERLADTANDVWVGLAPLPRFSAAAPWNTSIVPTYRAQPRATAILMILAVMTIAAVAWSLRKTAIALTFYAAGTCALLLFMYLKYSAGPRHSGHLFVVLLAATWIARQRTAASPTPLMVTLRTASALQLVAGIFFLVKSAYVPFSWSRELTVFVQQSSQPVVVADVTLVNYVGPVLSAYLQKPIDYVGPYRMRQGSFMILDEAHHGEAAAPEVRATLSQYALTRGAPTVLLVTSQWRHADELGPAVALFREHQAGIEGVASVRVVPFKAPLLTSRAEYRSPKRPGGRETKPTPTSGL